MFQKTFNFEPSTHTGMDVVINRRTMIAAVKQWCEGQGGPMNALCKLLVVAPLTYPTVSELTSSYLCEWDRFQVEMVESAGVAPGTFLLIGLD